jgi:hypothetical protein
LQIQVETTTYRALAVKTIFQKLAGIQVFYCSLGSSNIPSIAVILEIKNWREFEFFIVV